MTRLSQLAALGIALSVIPACDETSAPATEAKPHEEPVATANAVAPPSDAKVPPPDEPVEPMQTDDAPGSKPAEPKPAAPEVPAWTLGCKSKRGGPSVAGTFRSPDEIVSMTVTTASGVEHAFEPADQLVLFSDLPERVFGIHSEMSTEDRGFLSLTGKPSSVRTKKGAFDFRARLNFVHGETDDSARVSCTAAPEGSP